MQESSLLVFISFAISTFLVIPRVVHAQCSWEYISGKDNSGNSNGNSDISTAICRVKALDSATGVDLQTGIMNALNLVIQCSDKFLFDSELPKNSFHNVGSNLREVTIESCKLHEISGESLRGLESIKKITVNTYGKNLELQLTSFKALKDVEIINLANNNLRSIPTGTYCENNSLQVLNLTNNRLRSTDNIGFSAQPCSGEGDLRILDVSQNELLSIPENWGASKFRRLQQLNFQHNNITDISDDALSGLVSLRLFNISYNRLETIPSGLFAGARDLQEIHLQNNRIFEIPKGLFHRLEHLLILDISGNQLSSNHIDNSTFSGLIRLIVLKLAHNALTRIDAKTFRDLYFLQILDLRNNSIGYIDDNTFLPLYNLHTLNLAENRLHTINHRLFNGLFVLSKLTINNNLISKINLDAFRNCSDLKELDLSSNQIQEIPLAIQNLSILRTLDLGENQIFEIPIGIFRNLNQLTGLRLIDNQIGNVTKDMFEDVPRLSVLNLSRNRIQTIEIGSFDKNLELEALRLDKNYISDINGVFATLNSLLWLNLGENHLVWFDYAFIPSNLKWLDLHGNYITELGNYYKLQEQINIKTLDVSHNRLTEIGPMSVPNSIEILFINNNFINTVHTNTFVDKINLTRVDLYSNVLSKVHLHTFRISPHPPTKPLPEFYLAGNPFECDCSMDWLKNINNLTTRQHPRIVDLTNIECNMPHARSSHIRSLSSLETKDFLCQYETHCFALCHCCDFDACDCEMICPLNCTCYHDQTWNTNVVDCGRQNISELPKKMPMDTTVLYLDGNILPELKNNAFIGRKNLKQLFLNNSGISSVQKRTFVGLQSVEVIHLENNQLKLLHGHEFDNLMHLRELYLQNNHLDYLSNDTFASLQNIQILRIDGNRIATISILQHYRQYFFNLKSLTIGRNSWSCRCTFLRELTAFVAENALIIEDSQDIYCIDGGVKHELDLNSSSDCSGFYEGRSVMPELTINEHIPLLIVAFLLVFLFIILIMVIVFRESLRIWLFAKCGVRMCETPCEDYEKLYDAIFLYSKKDYELVTQEIAAELEIRPPPLRLCLQHRDLSQDATYLQILESTRVSKRIVILLTRNFLQTEWSRYEVRNAIHEALKDRPQKLIILEEENCLEAENDLEMLPYIKSKVVNDIKLSDKHFWEKLRYSLPAHTQQTCNNYTLHNHERLPKPKPSTAKINLQQSPPSYYQEHDDVNYSTATTATPSPRQNRQVADNEVAYHRPNSENIYFSIDYSGSTATGETLASINQRSHGVRIKTKSNTQPYMV